MGSATDAPNAPVRFDEGSVETGAMARLLRHRQTKEAETDRSGLTSTAPHSYSTVKPLRREGRMIRLYLWFCRVLFVARGPWVRWAPGLPCALCFMEGHVRSIARAS